MPIQILPFEREQLPQAGELLAQQHRRERAARPELPPRFADPAAASQAVAAALERPHAAGCAAFDHGRLVAFLIGDLQLDAVWGRSGWVRPAGCAYDPQAGAEIVRDLYAVLGGRWLDYGVFFHYALVSLADPALIDAWFRLSFGRQHVHALADLADLAPAMPAVPPGLEVRKAGPGDGPFLASLADLIWSQHVRAPVWAPQMPESVAENRSLWAEQIDEPDVTIWFAFQDGELAGAQGYWTPDPEPDNRLRPDGCAYMSLAVTRPEARGRGVGTLLSQCVLADAHAAGFSFVETNWRGTSLLGDRFFPRRGYRPFAYRLVRRLDERIVWAHGSPVEEG